LISPILMVSAAPAPPLKAAAATMAVAAERNAHGQREDDLVGAGRIVDAHFHAAEMAAHVGRIDMAQRDIEPRPHAADLDRRGHEGGRLAQQLAHRIAARHMPQRAMFQLAGRADNGALAIGFDRPRVAAQRVNQPPRHIQPQGFQRLHHRCDVRLVGPRIGIFDNRQHRRSADRCVGHGAAFVKNFVYQSVKFADIDVDHIAFHVFSQAATRALASPGPATR
jgi:hypothetical protein